MPDDRYAIDPFQASLRYASGGSVLDPASYGGTGSSDGYSFPTNYSGPAQAFFNRYNAENALDPLTAYYVPGANAIGMERSSIVNARKGTGIDPSGGDSSTGGPGISNPGTGADANQSAADAAGTNAGLGHGIGMAAISGLMGNPVGVVAGLANAMGLNGLSGLVGAISDAMFGPPAVAPSDQNPFANPNNPAPRASDDPDPGAQAQAAEAANAAAAESNAAAQAATDSGVGQGSGVGGDTGTSFAQGGISGLQGYGGAPHSGYTQGPGTGTSDSIPAKLSNGEFVFTAKAVKNAGSGNPVAGAQKLYRQMRFLERTAKGQPFNRGM